MNKNRLCWNPKAELIPEDEMKKLQLKEIKYMLNYVYRNSPFYKRKFKESGIRPDDIKSLDDFAKKVPITTKEELRDLQAKEYPFGENMCVSYDEIKWVIASTGTTGKPTYTGATRKDWKIWMESIKRGFWMPGFRPGDVYLHAYALGPWISGITYTQAAREMGMTVVPVGVPTPAPRMITYAKDCRANVMCCTPSYAEHLAERVQEILGIDPCDFGLRKLGCGGEPGAGIPVVRKRIEDLWNCDCRDKMGTPEQTPGNRAECYMKNGMHLLTREYTYDEIVDPDTKELIEPKEGIKGALVYTSLGKECSPLVRFYVGDQVQVHNEDCECGYPGYTMSVEARFDDMLKIRGVKVWPSAIKAVLLGLIPKVTGEFMIVLEEKPTGFAIRGPLKLRVERGQDLNAKEVENLKNEIIARVKSALYFTPNEVELVPPKALQRPEFKAKRIEITQQS